MTTMATPRKSRPTAPAAPAPAVPATPAITEESVRSAAEFLSARCTGIRYTVSMLPRSKAIKGARKRQMAEAVGAHEDSVSTSKLLFDSQYPLLKELNAARDSIDAWRDAHTIVSSTVATGEGDAIKAVNVRMIRIDELDEFLAGHELRVGQLRRCAERLAEHLEAPYFDGVREWLPILDSERRRHGETFDRSDYPQNLAARVGCSEIQMIPYVADVRLPEAVYVRMKAQVEQQLASTVEAAVTELTGTLVKTFTSLASQLSNRTRVFPDARGSLGALRDAEITARRESPGVVEFTLRTKEPLGLAQRERVLASSDVRVVLKEDSSSTPPERRGRIFVVGPLDSTAFQLLFRPQQTAEKKKLSTSTIDTLMVQLQNFSHLREMLGDPGRKIDESLDQVRQILTMAGERPAEAAESIRRAPRMAATLSGTLEKVCEQLEESAEEVREVRRKIRRLDAPVADAE